MGVGVGWGGDVGVECKEEGHGGEKDVGIARDTRGMGIGEETR